METATDAEKADVFAEIEGSAAKLMEDLFGNYVIQKFFEFGSTPQIEVLCDLLKCAVFKLSLQTYGCRVVQKAIECLPLELQVRVVSELDGHVVECVMDQNGNHVIQKCFECVSPTFLDFIITSFEGMVVPLATHPYGCRVIQRALEHANVAQCRRLLEEVLRNTYHLVQNQYGNYVMQHILEHGQTSDRAEIIQKLSGHLTTLSQHKYASNVVEKCISHCPTKALRYQIIEELMLQENILLLLLKDQYANYVMQKALDCADIGQGKTMVYRIRPHLPILRKYTYAKYMVIKVEKILMRSGSYW
jgi:pumilio RNA-binding family